VIYVDLGGAIEDDVDNLARLVHRNDLGFGRVSLALEEGSELRQLLGREALEQGNFGQGAGLRYYWRPLRPLVETAHRLLPLSPVLVNRWVGSIDAVVDHCRLDIHSALSSKN
jgi:hypothetical protein